jgi:WD40 repeat protein
MVLLVDPATGKELRRLKTDFDYTSPTRTLAFSRDGKVLAAVESQSIRLWDPTTGKELLPSGGHRGLISHLVYSPRPSGCPKRLASVGESVCLWDPATATELHRLDGPKESYATAAFSPDGKTLVCAGRDGMVHLWEAATGKDLHQLKNSATAFKLALSPDGKLLAAADHQERIRFWDLENRKELRRLDEPHLPFSHLVFSPDGKTLACGVGSNPVPLLEVGTSANTARTGGAKPSGELGKVVRTFGGDDEGATVAFSPDGKVLAGVGRGFQVRFWSVVSGKELGRLPKHPDQVNSLDFSPDGRVLATACYDGTVRLWELATGEEVCRFRGHQGPVNAVAFSPDGLTVASASFDTTVILWDVTGRVQRGHFQAARLSLQELEASWAALAGKDAHRAHGAVWTLSAAPGQAEPFLQKHLRPSAAVDPKRLERLLGALDHEEFVVRQEASEELAKLAELAEPALRKALEGRPSPEVRSRVERLLEQLEQPVPVSERLQELRAIAVLEYLATPGARELLAALSQGEPHARQTREAKAALERLAK